MLQNVSRILSMVYQVFYLRYAYKMDFLSGSPDSSTSEVTTLQLEFRDLGRCIDEDSNFEEAAAKIEGNFGECLQISSIYMTCLNSAVQIGHQN